jgi:hypothetical protein
VAGKVFWYQQRDFQSLVMEFSDGKLKQKGFFHSVCTECILPKSQNKILQPYRHHSWYCEIRVLEDSYASTLLKDVHYTDDNLMYIKKYIVSLVL